MSGHTSSNGKGRLSSVGVPEQSIGFFHAENISTASLETHVEQCCDPASVPLADSVEQNVPCYDAPGLYALLGRASSRHELMAEWARVLALGPGVFVLRRACQDTDAIEAATAVYTSIIDAERAEGRGGDHFAASGLNDRVWNALQKLAEHAPEIFVRYFANPMIDAVCEAWLGPGYQMTAQINRVRPGGQAQQPHRDYHLGFQSASAAARFPIHVHRFSPMLTLQGAIAHVDMPVASGPTKLLPFSQGFEAGYVAFRRPDVVACFERRHVQVPLCRGDALFFSPALLHAAGDNRTADVDRMANLLQVSSAFGRPMEYVDRASLCRHVYPALLSARRTGDLDDLARDALIAATAEGYAFPTDLDRDPPDGDAAPMTQATLLRDALAFDLEPREFERRLDDYQARRAD